MELLRELLSEDYDESPVMRECRSCGETYDHDENPETCPYCEEEHD